jgi:uncharacterized short protein YbdD (DUF466 family)
MFSLKSNLFASMLVEAKDYAKKFNRRRSHPPNSDMPSREWHRMQSELRAAREQARLMEVLHRNRIF